ncbi:glutaredoxin family protein [Aquincola sp. MAHUQ-54]|uniref:Glutaredoxin family protein n=1 Tax=Aquincola agrisoli TaxID=3119538 RepID=A0AAW9QC25_9BURK
MTYRLKPPSDHDRGGPPRRPGRPPHPALRLCTACGFAAATLLAGYAHAQAPAAALYKIVEPDGRITYTDRPITSGPGRVTAVNDKAGTVLLDDTTAALPLPLRTAASRFPVTLFAATDCVPCERGREFLRQRGVPFRERLASTDADREAWQRVVGAPEAPALAIGGQLLRGFAPDAWNEYLDVAGYPRDARLPASYRAPPPLPLAEVRPVAPPAAAASAPADSPTPAEAVPPAASGIRF